jgi:hypothetical protein
MTRTLVCALSFGALALLVPTGSSAQTFVDVGVWTPNGGGRVVVGGAPVYRGPRTVYVPARPVRVVQPYYRHDRGRHLGWSKKNRGYYGRDVYSRDIYGRDVWRAEAEYRRNLARAEREYYDDLRDARRRRW